DCFPMLLVDTKRRAVAAIHAGWRGTAQQVAVETVAAMVRTFGCTPDYLHAAIGPGIGKCCFEVGPEVARELTGVEEPMHVDLGEINRRQLIEAGLSRERIYSAGLCTVCNHREFFSYRRDRENAGRMRSVVGIKSNGREKTPAPNDPGKW
ncbi:MAG: polyphenol oxidase family protein, partial [Acidobacteriota bacterium]|nr:polyphenol oxidase family protein [Acidobacteriota bacterium]